jgi:AcrR family transcriptional regulator
MALSKEKRTVIRKELPYGVQKEIANTVGCSRMTIYRYFSGKCNSVRIEKAIIKKYCEIIKEHKKLINMINNVVNE